MRPSDGRLAAGGWTVIECAGGPQPGWVRLSRTLDAGPILSACLGHDTHARMSQVAALGSRTVSRIGFGAMQLAGPGVFGALRDPDAARAALRREAPESSAFSRARASPRIGPKTCSARKPRISPTIALRSRRCRSRLSVRRPDDRAGQRAAHDRIRPGAMAHGPLARSKAQNPALPATHQPSGLRRASRQLVHTSNSVAPSGVATASCGSGRRGDRELAGSEAGSNEGTHSEGTTVPRALGVGRLAPLANAAHRYAIDPNADQDRDCDHEDQRAVRARSRRGAGGCTSC